MDGRQRSRVLRGQDLALLLSLVCVFSAFASICEAAVGRTAGEFGVSISGAAQYSIPLWTPPGVNGLPPSLALVYSSRGSDRYLGNGWALTGFSSIDRCS